MEQMKQQQMLLAQLVNLHINNHLINNHLSMQSATISLQYITHNIIPLSNSSDSNGSGLPLAGVTNAQTVTLLVSQI